MAFHCLRFVLTPDLVKIVMPNFGFADDELHNGSRIQQIRSLEMWMDIGYTNEELGLVHLLNVVI